MRQPVEIQDYYKITAEMNLLRRFMDHGYDFAFNTAINAEEEHFLAIRKNNTNEQLLSEYKELKRQLK